MRLKTIAVIFLGLWVGCRDSGTQSPTPVKITAVLQPLDGGAVRWRTWSERDSARILNKPIMLFLYEQRSFWCRDLSRRCFEELPLASEVMRLSWPIMADADRQPDLLARFGRGGLPTLAFLRPNGDWISGATYLDPEDLEDLLRRVSFLFDNPDLMADLEVQRGELRRREALAIQRNPRPEIAPSNALVQRLLDSLEVSAQRGYEVAPEGALALFEARGSVGQIERTLSTRLDPDGSFTLYSFTPDGRVRDREKHLALNASFLITLGHVGQTRPEIAAAGRLLRRTLTDSYRQDGLFCAGYASFETPEGIPRDPTIYAGWNGLAISGLVADYRGGDDLAVAQQTLARLVTEFRREDGLFRHVRGQDTALYLEDQAFIARAALDIFKISGDAKILQLAKDLADGMLSRFGDPSGALRDREQADHPYYPVSDRWVPSACGVAAQVFVRLGAHTGEDRYRAAANRLLRATIGPNIDQAASMGALCRALTCYLESDGSGLN
ncbi:MAG: DUF255 domain-containing protein [bacterium]|jgi:uncharacterized protein YyaL (SSP411 family)|nr:DUF255 domain-containing protein [bacterium]